MIRQTTASKQSFTSDMDSILEVIWAKPNEPLSAFSEMWYNVFLWALFSSLFIHGVAAVVAFLTLRKHAVGRYITCTFTLYTSY